MKIYAIIPAGGKGIRSGYAVPKQYVKIHSKELIVYTLETFQKNKLVDEIIVPADPSYFKLLNRLKDKYGLTKISGIVEGGKERQDSVYNGLVSANAAKEDLIIIHDAARPLLSQEILTNSIETAKIKGNALVCILSKDTLIKGRSEVDIYIDRKEVQYVQTPQIFKYFDLLKAMKKAHNDNFIGTDESMLVHRIGKKINIVQGSALNFKVTTAEDFDTLRKLL